MKGKEKNLHSSDETTRLSIDSIRKAQEVQTGDTCHMKEKNKCSDSEMAAGHPSWHRQHPKRWGRALCHAGGAYLWLRWAEEGPICSRSRALSTQTCP